jgi:hypothetical protein
MVSIHATKNVAHSTNGVGRVGRRAMYFIAGIPVVYTDRIETTPKL